jgi:hypothetical protein
MYRLLFYFFIGFSSISLPSFAQKVVVNVQFENKVNSPESDTIYYDKNRKLTWNDFKGIPDMNHKGSAVTSSGFAYSWNGQDNGETLFLNISVYAFFTKSKSWMKKGVDNAYHLLHEQRHFDITMAGAENFVRELKKASFSTENYRKLINQIFDRVYDENIALQHQYDRETRNSLDKEKQEKWNQKKL